MKPPERFLSNGVTLREFHLRGFDIEHLPGGGFRAFHREHSMQRRDEMTSAEGVTEWDAIIACCELIKAQGDG